MIAVVGMGYAGRMALARIRAAGIEACAIDPLSSAVERTRLHEAVARGRSVDIELPRWLGQIGAIHHRSSAVRIAPGRISLEDGREVLCDAVVVAAGSVTDDGGVPGVDAHAHRLDSARAAHQLHEDLADQREIVVVGAGLTGIELSIEIAEAHPHLRIAMVGDLGALSERGVAAIDAACRAVGVRRVRARVTRVEARGVQTSEGFLPADRVIWAAGMRAPRWLAASGLPTDARGRILVDEALCVPGFEGVIAAGDCASTPLRMACATAMPMGCHAADTALRLLRGEAPRPMSFAYMLRCISLGRGSALIQGTDRCDHPTWTFSGRGAALIKETILRAAASMHAFEGAVGLPLYGWPKGAMAAAEVR